MSCSSCGLQVQRAETKARVAAQHLSQGMGMRLERNGKVCALKEPISQCHRSTNLPDGLLRGSAK